MRTIRSKFDIDKTEQTTMNGLKDFQKATVERIDYLFRNKQNRVLVADEVGMGKTLIARGAIVKTARLRMEENDDLFKVVYICSNTSIANQNIRKLKVSGSTTIEGVSDTRLSMQHLKITMQENDQELRDGYIQLIPLTPDTSFRLTNGRGTYKERALMFAILRRMDEFKSIKAKLETLLRFGAVNAWTGGAKQNYENMVCEAEIVSNRKYPANLIQKIYDYNENHHVIDILLQHITTPGNKEYSESRVINMLRVMFAQISTEMLDPDLVIMDEFQRFKFLIDSDMESETGILAHKFLGSDDTRVLLLSATPYKLYSTMEEIEERHEDEHYSEFFRVMDFLFDDNKEQFRNVWSNYSAALYELKKDNQTIIRVKNAAEEAMYGGVCRTERISVMESGDYTDDSSVKNALEISENDIKSYLAMNKLLEEVDADFHLPLDYVKSCPYLMSYMRNYKVKKYIEKYLSQRKEDIGVAKNKLLWVDRKLVNQYKELPKVNARLEKLKDAAFENNAEMYLWIPPSLPYYDMHGVYTNSKGFSKVLVFSSWEMVPRMIGSLISYEMERKTVGRLCSQEQNMERKNARYYAKTRYPNQRLRFVLKDNAPQGMNLFCLMYPSEILADMYNPVECKNAGMSLAAIERDIKRKLKDELEYLKKYQSDEIKTEDIRWYYLAPMLFDGICKAEDWIYEVRKMYAQDKEEGRRIRGSKAVDIHLDKLKTYLKQRAQLRLGKMPEDLIDTLTDMVIASPAICAYRTNGYNQAYATAIARLFVYYFNSTESTAIVELAAGQYHRKRADDNSHWQDVLAYCKDGCFQAMYDEYYHLVKESIGFSEESVKSEQVQNIMLSNLRTHTASYDVDTYNNFKRRLEGGKDKNLMRAHYAAGFVNSEADSEKTAGRKDSIRGAFNSPLKPFVLATTSIGQEGLDFHNYCRRIMHWNLPGNPIDLEQREGRINRFKCLAIRQNVAEQYSDIQFSEDVWKEMFSAAEAERGDNQSELVPFWCFGKNQSVKIERMVPMYPMSKDEEKYERLMKILSLYRLTLGQARQEELLEYLYKECDNAEELKKLFIDLSPFSKQK